MDTLQSTGVEDQPGVCVPGTGQFPKSTCIRTKQSGEGIRYRGSGLVLSWQKVFVDNYLIQEPFVSSDHNQLHFNIKIKSDKSKVKQYI